MDKVQMIAWAATAKGYVVARLDADGQIFGDILQGNNNSLAGGNAVPPGKWPALSDESIREGAETTALELAEEEGIAAEDVFYHEDMEDFLVVD